MCAGRASLLSIPPWVPRLPPFTVLRVGGGDAARSCPTVAAGGCAIDWKSCRDACGGGDRDLDDV